MLILCRNIPAVAQAYIMPALLTDEHSAAAVDGDVCARCDKQVFIAEKRQAAGRVCTMTSLLCFECNCWAKLL